MLRVRETREWPKNVVFDSSVKQLEDYLVARYVLELGENHVEFIHVYSLYQVEGNLLLHITDYRVDKGFGFVTLREIEPDELKLYFGPGILKEIHERLGLRA